MTFADTKTTARRAIHRKFAVPCLYDPLDGTAPVTLQARLHGRQVVSSDGGGAYATIIENVSKAVFNREELAALGVTLVRNARIVFTEYPGFDGPVVYVLDNREAVEGPINEKWSLAGV